LHIIIKLHVNIVPPYVTTPVQSQVTLRKIITGEFSRKTGSSSAVVFPGEVFVHSSVIASILSIDRSLNTKHYLISLKTLTD